MSLKLTSSQRLKNRKDFSAFFNSPEVFRSGSCTLFRIPNDLPKTRLGISLKFEKKPSSVFRNKVRRTVKEWFRVHQPTENTKSSFDYNILVYLKPPYTHESIKRVIQTLSKLTPALRGSTST